MFEEMKARWFGKRIKHSEYSARGRRDAWLSCGQPGRKEQLHGHYLGYLEERGHVIEVIDGDRNRGVLPHLRILWDDGHESTCLQDMVEVAED